MNKWIENVSVRDWQAMTPQEREKLIYSILRIEKKELAKMVAEFEYENNRKPNALFVSYQTLVKMPVKVKHFRLNNIKLTVIPMDAPEGHFSLSLQDPWLWGNLFYS